LSLALLVAASATANAAERLQMPYECQFDGARVRMWATTDVRSYTVLGPHDRQIFSTCAPDDPTSCRSWHVHRFDFDCNGTRVSWLEAAGAATRDQNWDAWVDDGAFHMRMGRGWGVAPARGEGERRRRRDRYDEFNRDPFGPGGFRDQTSVVTMPRGFAPAMGIALAFSGADAPVAQGGAPWSAHGGDIYARRAEPGREPPLQTEGWQARAPQPMAPPPDGVASPFETTTRVEPPLPPPAAASRGEPGNAPSFGSASSQTQAAVPEPGTTAGPPADAQAKAHAAAAPDSTAAGSGDAASPRDKTLATSAPEAAAPVPQPGAAASEHHEEPAATTSVARQEPQVEPPKAARPGNAPTIINEHGIAGPAPERPDASSALADLAAKAGKDSGLPRPASDGVSADEAAAPAPAAATQQSGAKPAEGMPIYAPQTPAAPGGMGEYTLAVAISAALLVLAGAVFMFWRREEAPAPEEPLRRDIGDISLGGTQPPERTLNPSQAAAAPTEGGSSGPDALEDVPVPESYDEALSVLGANPDASLGDIKKIVDGLRRNWHPDHAASEADRVRRERRLQQINVAWDLVSKQRSAA
jgi:hypothetical protein